MVDNEADRKTNTQTEKQEVELALLQLNVSKRVLFDEKRDKPW